VKPRLKGYASAKKSSSLSFFEICEGNSHEVFFYNRAERNLEADYLPIFVKTEEEDVWRRKEK